MPKHERAIDWSKINNSNTEFIDTEDQTEKIDFKSLLWIQIGNINKAITMNRPDLFCQAVKVLEININYFLQNDKEYDIKLKALIKKYDELKNKIPMKERIFGEARLEAIFSEEKYWLLMYFLGKKGYLN